MERWGKDGRGYYNSPYFYSAIKKYGWDAFEHEILYVELTKEEACNKEIELIKKYHTQDKTLGYNIMEGGSSPVIPEEVKQKMSERMMGNKNGLGKPCTEEKKEKISKAQKGRRLTEEHKAKLSLAKKGKSHASPTEETRKKISNSHKKNPVLCIEKETVYESIQECARQLGLWATLICKCCKGTLGSTGGLHFCYYDEHNNMQMPNDYPEREYAQASGNGSPLTHYGEGEDIV